MNFDPGFFACPVDVVSSFIPYRPFFRSLGVSNHGGRRIQYKNVLGFNAGGPRCARWETPIWFPCFRLFIRIVTGANTPCRGLMELDKHKGMPTIHLYFVSKRTLIVATQVSIFAMAMQYFTGCASGNYQRADVAGECLRTAGQRIDAENRSIDMTLTALDDLVNKPSPDLKPQFERFSTSLDRLVAASARAQKAAEVADKKSAEYFRNWDKETSEIKYEAVREQSVSRKTDVSNEFNTVNERYRQNQAVIEPLISYLQDIRTALGTDLTLGGVQSVKNLADNAQQNGRKVQAALAKLTDELAASGARMSSVSLPDSQGRGGVSDATESSQDRTQSSQ